MSVSAVIKPVGPENAVGVISSTDLRDPADPQWHKTREHQGDEAWMKKYDPAGDVADALNVNGCSIAQTMGQVLKPAGDNLTRENIMKQAASLSFTPHMLFPGIEIKTSADDLHPTEKLQLVRFNGSRYAPFGGVLGR